MQRFKILALMSILTTGLSAQIINTGATIVIQSGATLKVETDFINNTGGIVTNNGTLEITGNFENNATFNSVDPSLVKFSGTGASNVKTGGAVFRNVEVAKENGNVILTDLDDPNNMVVDGTLTFTGNVSNTRKIVLNDNNLTYTSGADIGGAGPNAYIVTNDAGVLIKGISANSTRVLEVGDMANYSPITNVVTGTGYNSSSTIRGRVYTTETDLQDKYGETTDYINREWNIVADGFDDYTNTMTGTYVGVDRVGMASLIKGATYRDGDWRFDGSAGNGSDMVTASTTTHNVKFSGKNFFGKANLKVLLAGPYIGGGMMSTSLNSILPASTPYTVAPFNAPNESYTVKPVNATDWILVELRDPVTPSTVLSQKSAWLLNNGNVVGLDGNALTIKDGNPNSIVSIRHRNHLGVRTSAGIDLVNPTLQNYSAGSAFGTHPQRIISSTSVMWPGNTFVDGSVKFTGSNNDLDPILNNILAHPGNLFGLTTFSYSMYNVFDVNLDGIIRYTGTDNDSDVVLNNVLSHPGNFFALTTFAINQQL